MKLKTGKNKLSWVSSSVYSIDLHEQSYRVFQDWMKYLSVEFKDHVKKKKSLSK